MLLKRFFAFISFYLSLFGSLKRQAILIFIFLFIENFYYFVPLTVVGIVVDILLKGEQVEQIKWICLLLAIISCIVHVIRLEAKTKIGILQNTAGRDLRALGFLNLVSGNLESRAELSGIHTQQINNGVNSFYALGRFIYNHTFRVISTLIVSFFSLVLVLPSIIWLPAIYVFFICYFLKDYQSKMTILNEKLVLAREKSSGAMFDSLNNATTIKVLQAQQGLVEHVQNFNEQVLTIENKIYQTSRRLWQYLQSLNAVFLSLGLFFLALHTSKGTLTVGAVVIVFGYFQSVTNAFLDFINIWEQFLESKAGINRLKELLGKDIKRLAEQAKSTSWNNIELESISFKYNEKKIFKNLDFTCKRGETIGIIGKSGSGKTTLARILVGALSPSEGKFFVDGKNILNDRNDNIGFFAQTSMALQECEIFGMSLEDNITLLRKIDQDVLYQVIKLTEIDILAKQIGGISTVLGEKGYVLSGGQRQRVSLARALCTKPRLLILDEATVMLDGNSEQNILQKIRNFIPDTTIIIIAHHDRTLSLAEKIYELTETGLLLKVF
jgi:ABC-type bacteriocin/lantibiotic exporter with double-glycine peptidase domain